jgi:REP element-mobilizing transposase RayT
MARPLRIEFPGALYHVTSRGNARAPIFLDDHDRLRFLRTLGETVEQRRWLCHAYCLMANHYHLVFQTPEPNLSRGMHQLNGTYTQGFNKRHGRVGHPYKGASRPSSSRGNPIFSSWRAMSSTIRYGPGSSEIRSGTAGRACVRRWAWPGARAG